MSTIKIFIFFIIQMYSKTVFTSDFYSEQLKYQRVLAAHNLHNKEINNQFKRKNVSFESFDLYIRAFKLEQKIELWIKPKSESKFIFLKSYDFCKNSGVLGPKRKEGDLQIPEGLYEIEYFNPESSFHLSFKINYPNESDLILSDKIHAGNDIFVHGKCETVGCIPIGDENIEELYLIAIKAHSLGAKIPVHIFPNIMSDENLLKISNQNPKNSKFWSNLQQHYLFFENHRFNSVYKIDTNGNYVLNL